MDSILLVLYVKYKDIYCYNKRTSYRANFVFSWIRISTSEKLGSLTIFATSLTDITSAMWYDLHHYPSNLKHLSFINPITVFPWRSYPVFHGDIDRGKKKKKKKKHVPVSPDPDRVPIQRSFTLSVMSGTSVG